MNQPTRIVNYGHTEASKGLSAAMSTADGESLRNRGRPRKVPTAAPDTVRRTQLREAQRAYRSRQQSLLASLKSRVARLEDAFGQLNQIMDSFDAQVIKPGAQMSHAQLFQAVKLFQNEICFQLERVDSHASPNEGKERSSTTTQRQDSCSQNLLRFRETNGVLAIPSDEQWFDIKDLEGFLMEQGIKTEESYHASVNSSSITNSNPSAKPGLLLPSGNIVGSADLTSHSPTTSSNVVMVLDEATLIDKLSRLCICLGCVAGFRRSDVETLVWQHVIWKPI
ncbi:hypothetical protein AARAC_009711 [Aspergillus arachidicola]|uniref:BZIP domain-containing protein n=1 Tax=Aspergillus arachidicola TaxID=656916 RepID=A0A2G7G4X9_9EURO|nr:hypothetical protein AARAC_009711 [Aspergillus arachidicola]